MTNLKFKRKAIVYFFAVILLYTGMLTYLLFFTPGLEMVEEKEITDVELFIANTSIHAIRDVEVITETGNRLLAASTLMPGEKKRIPLEGLSGYVTVKAIAPFHASTMRGISLKGIKGVKLSYETYAQNIAVKGERLKLTLKVCNTGAVKMEEVRIDENHSMEFFQEETVTRTIPLEIGECAQTDYLLTPQKKGETEIYFNIKALSVSEQFTRKITIEEV